MPTRVEILHTRERADRALRNGRPREALGALLAAARERQGRRGRTTRAGSTARSEPTWRSAGRGRPGYVLLGLRRFAEAQRHFPAAERPLEWAVCAAQLGRHGEAARVLSESGHPVLAAIELEAARRQRGGAARVGARARRSATRRAPLRDGARPLQPGRGAAADRRPRTVRRAPSRQAQRLLEAVADDFETRGEPERAFDCYSVLLRLGKETGLVRDRRRGVPERDPRPGRRGPAAGDAVLRRLLDLRRRAAGVVRGGDGGARGRRATACTPACPTIATTSGVPSSSGSRRARQPGRRRAGRSVGQRASRRDRRGDVARRSGVVRAPLRGDGRAPARRAAAQRYRPLAQRYEAMPAGGAPPAVSFPEHLRRTDAYLDVWRQDLVEWELGGDPTAVLARQVADHPPRRASIRARALRALLLCDDPEFSTENPARRPELAVTLGRRCLRGAPPARAALRAPGRGGAGGGHAGRRRGVSPAELRPRSQGVGRSGAGGRRRGAAGAARDALRRRARVGDPDLPRVDRRAGAAGGAGRHRRGSTRSRRRWRGCCSRPCARRPAPSARRPRRGWRSSAATRW